MVFTDAAISDEAAGVRPSGCGRERLDRLHAGAARRSGEARVEIQNWTAVHAAGGQQDRRSAGDARAALGNRRNELAWRLVRSRDARPLRVLADDSFGAWPAGAARY